MRFAALPLPPTKIHNNLYMKSARKEKAKGANILVTLKVYRTAQESASEVLSTRTQTICY